MDRHDWFLIFYGIAVILALTALPFWLAMAFASAWHPVAGLASAIGVSALLRWLTRNIEYAVVPYYIAGLFFVFSLLGLIVGWLF